MGWKLYGYRDYYTAVTIILFMRELHGNEKEQLINTFEIKKSK